MRTPFDLAVETVDRPSDDVLLSHLAWADETSISYIAPIAENQEGGKQLMSALSIETRQLLKAGKRIRRFMRPHKYAAWMFLEIAEVDWLDPVAFDGLAIMHPRVQTRLWNRQQDVPDTKLERRRYQSQRYNITIQDREGQIKGHAIIGQTGGPDIVIAKGQWKREVLLHQPGGMSFIALEPVRAKAYPKADIQSIVNLAPLFQPANVTAWLDSYIEHLAEAIERRDLDPLAILEDFESEDELNRHRHWWIADYLASGGHLPWLRLTMNAMVKTVRNHLATLATKVRVPFPGWYAYIAPELPGSQLAPGHCRLDLQRASLFVATETYRDECIPVLGGCDADDAVWVMPATVDGQARYIVWRSPNQPGEYIILTPIDDKQPSIAGPKPDIAEAQLFTRIDRQAIEFTAGTPEPVASNVEYSTQAVCRAWMDLQANRGALGGYCNALMLIAATLSRPAKAMPYPLETVIDGTVKEPIDLSAALAWVQSVMTVMHDQLPARVPAALAERVVKAVRLPNGRIRLYRLRKTQPTDAHIDQIVAAIGTLSQQSELRLSDLVASVITPTEILAAANEPHADIARAMLEFWRKAYSRSRQNKLEKADAVTVADELTTAFLADWSSPLARGRIALTALALTEIEGISNHALTSDALWPIVMTGLKSTGLVAEVEWFQSAGAIATFTRLPEKAQASIRVNGFWYNFLAATVPDRYNRMSDVPADERARVKAAAPAIAKRLIGYELTIVRDGERQLAYGPSGRLVGYISRQTPVLPGAWQVASVIGSEDGNVTLTIERYLAD